MVCSHRLDKDPTSHLSLVTGKPIYFPKLYVPLNSCEYLFQIYHTLFSIIMIEGQKQFAHLSEVNPDFAPLIPGVNIAFEKIWQYRDMTEFRGNWTKTRSSYPDFVPSEGFEITHRKIPARDGTEVEIRIWRPTTPTEQKLPLLFVLHGGGTFCSLFLNIEILIDCRICCWGPRLGERDESGCLREKSYNSNQCRLS